MTLTREPLPALTDERRAALEAFAEAHGQTWREQLADAWLNCSEPPEHKAALRQVRNVYGPTWLMDVYAFGWLPALPRWQDMRGRSSAVPIPDAGAKWSADFAPPAVGDLIRVRINSLGLGKVTGYFVESGWLGVTVKLMDPPAWYAKQNGGNVVGHSFGAEIDLATAQDAAKAAGAKLYTVTTATEELNGWIEPGADLAGEFSLVDADNGETITVKGWLAETNEAGQ